MKTKAHFEALGGGRRKLILTAPHGRWRGPGQWQQKEWLLQEYGNGNKTIRQIARETGLSAKTIAYWLRKHGIEIRKPGPRGSVLYDKKPYLRNCTFNDAEWLKLAYWQHRRSIASLASQFGVSQRTMRRQLVKCGLIPAPRPWRSREWMYDRLYNAKVSLSEIARETGIDIAAVSRWVKKHGLVPVGRRGEYRANKQNKK